VHGAKGLEAPVVILADTAGLRSARRLVRFKARMARLDTGEFLRLDGPTFRNAAAIAASLDDARHEAAEDVRLLYVALTRACDRLFVFGGGTRRSAWGDALAGWHEGVTHRPVAGALAERRLDPVSATGAPAASARYNLAAMRSAATTALPFRAPSGAGDEGDAAAAVEGALAPELAREVGRIVHARLAGQQAQGEGVAFDEAAAILRAFASSPLAERLGGLHVLGREVPMLLDEDGARWQGTIDLVYRDRDGTVVVADFKTDASLDAAIERHSDQLRIYARAVRRAMALERVRAELWMLRSGRILEV